MKHLVNSTKTFIETLKRQAVGGKDASGADIILDGDLQVVYTLYNQNKLKFQDHVIEAAITTSSLQTVKVLDEADAKIVGVRNIALAKLNENEYFCPVAITILGATTANDTAPSNIQGATFAPIGVIAGMQNGKVDFIVNQTDYLMREIPMSRWIGLNTIGQGGDAPAGTVFLDNFTIMKPNLRNEINITWGIPLPTTTAIKVLLHGTRTQPK